MIIEMGSFVLNSRRKAWSGVERAVDLKELVDSYEQALFINMPLGAVVSATEANALF